MAGLREAPDEDLVAGLQEEHLGLDPASFERAAHRGQGQRRVAGPHVEHDRDLVEAVAVVRYELRQVGQQLTGQVVDDGVAEVLEQLGGGRLAGPRQPAQDDDVLALRRLGGRRRGPTGRGIRSQSSRPVYAATERGPLGEAIPASTPNAGQLPPRAMNQVVASYRMYIVTPSTNGLTRSPPGVAIVAKMVIPRIT